MPSRRSHRKSRYGCTACKRRRVKCDERRPECSNCANRNTPCTYAPHVSTEDLSPDSSSCPLPPRSQAPNRLYKFTTPGWMDDTESQPQASELNLVDMELLLNWCSTTYVTMAHTKQAEHIYQYVLPKEGLSYPFVLHGLLALSALHIARTRAQPPSSHYFSIALEHQNRALTLFRPVVLSINRENSETVFAFAGILLQLAFAMSPCSPFTETYDPIRELIQAFTLCGGLREIIGASWNWVKEGKLAEVVLDVDDSKHWPLPDAVQTAISHLECLNQYRAREIESHDPACYGSAIDHLRDLMEIYQDKPQRVEIALRWPFGLQPKYVDLLREHDPMALVILAHYCLVLHHFRDHWWMEGWSSHVARHIWKVLGEYWRPSVSWVMKEIGLEA
ncbi:hypothetical protein IFM61392_00854 [Aspergillus lentulus]|uniref:Zn(2)-C6 fungal-type domain-containing protein n=1 Tax=Aspergillus lentulus TaxID=293939 RepID=A0ABQ1AMB3_ASPLE|nr:hypothetical protein IFM47457_03350 [Aspergillus lentulus]GFF84555.1 hypothetical protein IFM60648_07067 [Aspergillus lentulus]GFF99485.1 hypothetical protein IFM61392_00854 [Aspergillus lentulus]